jgi:hypothetical protein
MKKNKQSFDWQRAQAANDRYVIGSQVKNAIPFYLTDYNENVDTLVTVLKRFPLVANPFVCNEPEACTNIVTLLPTVPDNFCYSAEIWRLMISSTKQNTVISTLAHSHKYVLIEYKRFSAA